MSQDYPDIEREVPAWAGLIAPDMKHEGKCISQNEYGVTEFEGQVLNPKWLTGLAQFVRVVQKPLEERIAALEEETAWIKRYMPAREVERIAATIPTEEKPQYPSCLGCIHYSKSPAEDPCSRRYAWQSFYTAKSPTPSDLAEQLADKAVDSVSLVMPTTRESLRKELLPYFRRAVEGSKGGEE